MFSSPRPVTSEEFAAATHRTDLRSIEMRLFMCMSADGIDIDIIDEDEDEGTAMTMSIRVPNSFNSALGGATVGRNWNHRDVCRITGGDQRTGYITLMEFRMRRGRAVVLALTRDGIHDLLNGSNYVYIHRDKWVEFGEVRGAWIAEHLHVTQALLTLAA